MTKQEIKAEAIRQIIDLCPDCAKGVEHLNTILSNVLDKQKAIDDEEQGKALLYAVHKTAERTKKEVIQKAKNWLKARNVLTEDCLEGFVKVMEEE